MERQEGSENFIKISTYTIPEHTNSANVPWSCHDLGHKHCLDDGMAAMFLRMVAMIRGIFLVRSPCFPLFMPISWYDYLVFDVLFK